MIITNGELLERIFLAFLHDVAIATYIGGAVAMEFVLNPAQRTIPPAQAQVMGQKSADRFLWLVWGSLVFIIVTGLLRVWRSGRFDDFFDWGIGYGRTLSAMLLIFILLVINGLLITFVLRPRLAGKMQAGVTAQRVAARQDTQMQAARYVEILTRVDIVLALIAAFLGASLKLGGFL